MQPPPSVPASSPETDPPGGAVVNPCGHWEGTIEFQDTSLPVRVDLTADDAPDARLHGTIDLTTLGLRGHALVDVAREGDVVRFEIPHLPGRPRFNGTLSSDGRQWAGAYSQHDDISPFTLRRFPCCCSTQCNITKTSPV